MELLTSLNCLLIIANIVFGVWNIISFKSNERFKHNLEVETLKSRLKYSSLHEKRVVCIEQLFVKLQDSLFALQRFTSPVDFSGAPNKEELAKAFFEVFHDLWSFAQHKRIWLDEELCSKIDEVLKPMYKAYVDFNFSVLRQEAAGGGSVEKWNEVWNKSLNEIPMLVNAVERRFRELLGGDK
jgi:hypothetical protein